MAKKKTKTKVETNNENEKVKVVIEEKDWGNFYKEYENMFDFSEEEISELKKNPAFSRASSERYLSKFKTYEEANVFAAVIRARFLTACSEYGCKIPVRMVVTEMNEMVESFMKDKKIKIQHEKLNLFYHNELKVSPYILIDADFPAESLEAVALKNCLDYLFTDTKALLEYTNHYYLKYLQDIQFKDALLDFLEIVCVKSFREDILQLKFLYNYFCINDSEISNKIAFLLPQDVPEEVVVREIQSLEYFQGPHKYKYNDPPYLAIKEYSVNYAPTDCTDCLLPKFSCELIHHKNY